MNQSYVCMLLQFLIKYLLSEEIKYFMWFHASAAVQNEVFALAAWIISLLPKLRDSLSGLIKGQAIQEDAWSLKTGPIGSPETRVNAV